ncbi:MAG: hypothetical protein WDO24_07210 [Pseudomonadota bacterium]
MARAAGQPPIILLIAPVGPMTALHSLPPAIGRRRGAVQRTRRVTRDTRRNGFRALFGLTKAEAMLAQALLDGKRLTEIASSRNVSSRPCARSSSRSSRKPVPRGKPT